MPVTPHRQFISGERIVIGDRERFQSGIHCRLDQFIGRVRTVRFVCMSMKIDQTSLNSVVYVRSGHTPAIRAPSQTAT